MKNNLKKQSWSSTEIGTLIEDFTSQVKLVAEQTAEIPKIDKKVDLIQEDLEIMKTDIDVIKADLGIVKSKLDRKTDQKDTNALEHRVALLESRR